ncbi:MAG: 1,3-beta-galactosyl-N-acetylhexosamine phosphorylase N-terminal domain-containing protein, partial [Lachnospiraceae bacterium]|nr:1,3-beta-galactosyl-N-acetylhexosamine phosphorylase N-terminal domain-containing protein [Lachnospiraceae bacterium]
MGKTKGSFTLPGEAGYEKLTLELAERWGADVIRDSDGTELSPEITEAGYGIYSTICIIRGHNEWAKAHPEQLQQTFLMTSPKTAVEETLVIHLMEDFFDQQFRVNDSRDAMKYWQVYDRTEEREVSSLCWTYDRECGNVVLQGVPLFHEYTVSFLAYRIWEEISMYNHVTNHWNAEHLMPVDPRYPETRAYLKGWLKNWCETHPATTVVRFTSLFYNFVWIWGSHEENRNLFSDWGSYDFTVSPLALEEFEKAYGYGLTAEDFINQGKLHVTHMPPSKKQKDYM